jgi:hypothetical protein
MAQFVPCNSIVRKIWGNTDVTLFIFAGAAAEFALNKEVDWLYFTGRLPADPIGRLFSTVTYAQRIIFNEEDKALNAIRNINAIHKGVEINRGRNIPAEAYLDVLYMLIHYSMAAFELLERKLTAEEKDEMIITFSRIGHEMNLANIPPNYNEWLEDYNRHLDDNLAYSKYSADLFVQYRKHLGWFRYFLLLEIQRMTVSSQVNKLLKLGRPRIARILLIPYRLLRRFAWNRWLIFIMIPKKFKKQFEGMDSINRKEELR